MAVHAARRTAPATDPGRVLTRAALRAAEILDVPQRTLAEIIGVSASTISRAARAPLDPGSKPGQLAALWVRVFRSLDAIVGNDAAKVATWMSSYNQALNGVPRELIESPQGLVMTLQYVDAMRATS